MLPAEKKRTSGVVLSTPLSLLFLQGFAISVVSFRVETTLRGRNMENNLQCGGKNCSHGVGGEKYQGEWAAHWSLKKKKRFC